MLDEQPNWTSHCGTITDAEFQRPCGPGLVDRDQNQIRALQVGLGCPIGQNGYTETGLHHPSYPIEADNLDPRAQAASLLGRLCRQESFQGASGLKPHETVACNVAEARGCQLPYDVPFGCDDDKRVLSVCNGIKILSVHHSRKDTDIGEPFLNSGDDHVGCKFCQF